MNYNDYQANQNSPRLHFWFRARLGLIAKLLGAAYGDRAGDRSILDVGGGIGTEAAVLKKYGRVTVLDNDRRVLALVAPEAEATVAADIEIDDLPAAKFDGICCFDVLEHLSDDRPVLKKLALALKPNGCLFFTVPSSPFLFGPHDIASGHKRRYSLKKISEKIAQSGLEVVKIGYWNSLLYPAVVLWRSLKKFFYAKAETEAKPLPAWIDQLLYSILNSENSRSLDKNGWPFGLTIYGYARKERRQS